MKYYMAGIKGAGMSALALLLSDLGFDVVKKVITSIVVPYIEDPKITFFSDYKSALQEYVQTDRKSLEYVLINEYGQAHDKTFEVEVKIDDIVYGKGIGKSKKEAEQKAAFDAYKKSAK